MITLAKAIVDLIKQLGIENGNIEIKVSPDEPSENGLDLVEMLFSANKVAQQILEAFLWKTPSQKSLTFNHSPY